jgi:hypothetical protein
MNYKERTSQQEITLREFHGENGGFLKININESTLERCIVRGNTDLLDAETFNDVVEEIRDLSPDKLLIYTGANNLGQRLAEALMDLGRIILLLPVGMTMAKSENLFVANTDHPDRDYPSYLDQLSLWPTMQPNPITDREEVGGGVPIYSHESALY